MHEARNDSQLVANASCFMKRYNQQPTPQNVTIINVHSKEKGLKNTC